jgi:O-antigen ligase
VSHLILYAFLLLAAWLIRRDIAKRDGISAGIWIPTLWAGILMSRSLSAWLGFGGAEDTLEGSPVDRLFFFVMIAAAFITLKRRRMAWAPVIARNWPIFLFYAYLLVSVLWAESSSVSFKRWFKEFGNIPVALVILTEVNPREAFRAVFVRCAYLLIPLSVIFIRYFPDLGRRYSMHSGQMEATGVTFQKNSLGAMILVTGLILIWDWLERSRPEAGRQKRLDRWLPPALLATGIYLLLLCDSKTSMACLVVGAIIIGAARLPLFRRRVGALGIYVLAAVMVFFLLDSMFGISASVLSFMGRDATFTGRTDVWRVLLDLKTDPLFGTGFCSFWSDAHYQSQLPDWVAFSAHNGYLETYIDGGWLGIFFLAVMLLAVALMINRHLAAGGNYALVRFAAFMAILVGAFSESHFGRMSPLGFLFLLSALEGPWIERRDLPPDATKGTFNSETSTTLQAEHVPAYSWQ